MHISELYFGRGIDSWNEENLYIFRTLNHRDIFEWIQFFLAHLPFEVQHNFELGHVAHLESRQIYSEMNTAIWWWESHNQLLAGARIMPVIGTSDKAGLANIFRDQRGCPLYHIISYVWHDISGTPKKSTWILIGLIPGPLKYAKNTDEAWHSAIRTVLSLALAKVQNL